MSLPITTSCSCLGREVSVPRPWELTGSSVTLVRCHAPATASSFCATRAKGPDELSLQPGEAENLCCPCFLEQEQRDEGTE